MSRAYQTEMFEASLKQNVIVAVGIPCSRTPHCPSVERRVAKLTAPAQMDTGSGEDPLV